MKLERSHVPDGRMRHPKYHWSRALTSDTNSPDKSGMYLSAVISVIMRSLQREMGQGSAPKISIHRLCHPAPLSKRCCVGGENVAIS